MNKKDERPAPRPRKHPQLWQAYLNWNELVEMRKRHTLRIAAIDAGKSTYDRTTEVNFLAAMAVEVQLVVQREAMIEHGEDVGPVWDWLTSFRGLGQGGLAAQLVAHIDDISRAPTVSALWRFAGQAVIDGKAERNKLGEKSHFNSRLKSVVWLIGEQFIRQQTGFYVDIYEDEKIRQRKLHPDIVVIGEGKKAKKYFTKGHLHNRAKRKMMKIFLQHFWIVWRTAENLPVSEPYVIAHLGHTKYIQPPQFSPKS